MVRPRNKELFEVNGKIYMQLYGRKNKRITTLCYKCCLFNTIICKYKTANFFTCRAYDNNIFPYILNYNGKKK